MAVAARRQRDHIVARPAASPGQLDGYAKRIAVMVAELEAVVDEVPDCSVCGRGEHVAHCPVPSMKVAIEKLQFMANIPVTAVHVRGHSEGAA